MSSQETARLPRLITSLSLNAFALCLEFTATHSLALSLISEDTEVRAGCELIL